MSPLHDGLNPEKILRVEYMSGLDIEFADDAAKERFVNSTFVIKHLENGLRTEKIPTKDLQVRIPWNPPRFLTVYCPVSESNVTAIQFVDDTGNTVYQYDWEPKN